jgi:hypothetical protein
MKTKNIQRISESFLWKDQQDWKPLSQINKKKPFTWKKKVYAKRIFRFETISLIEQALFSDWILNQCLSLYPAEIKGKSKGKLAGFAYNPWSFCFV